MITNKKNMCTSTTNTSTCCLCMEARYRSDRGIDEGYGPKCKWSTHKSVMEFFICLLFVSLWCPTFATMNITAFEYRRKFNKSLSLGECPQREVAINMGNNSYYIETQKCTLYQSGTVSRVALDMNDPARNVIIASVDQVVPLLGLCGGEAASFLGVLNSGDCVAVEIGSRLMFSDKTLIRAFISSNQKYMDTLERTNYGLEGMEEYYKDKYYLKERSYGTLEIIIVQFYFESVLDTQEAKKIKLSSPVMSTYMREIANRAGWPKNVVVISLSTANMETFQMKHFKRGYWERAVRHVQIAELNIQRTKHQISADTASFHLHYTFHPFLERKDDNYRLTEPADWKDVSILEVQLRQALSIARKVAKKCRGNRAQPCRRMRLLKQKLTTAQTEVHKGRSNWMAMKSEEKSSFAKLYKANVDSYIRVTQNLAKSVRGMERKESSKWNTGSDFQNQIPTNTEERITKRQRRTRHTGTSRNKARNTGNS